MKPLSRIILLLVSISVTSCMTSYRAFENKYVLDELVGMPQERVIERLGAPSDIVDYQNGTILVYEGNEVAFKYII